MTKNGGTPAGINSRQTTLRPARRYCALAARRKEHKISRNARSPYQAEKREIVVLNKVLPLFSFPHNIRKNISIFGCGLSANFCKKTKEYEMKNMRTVGFVAATLMAIVASAQVSTTNTWDADIGTSGAQDGSGTWTANMSQTPTGGTIQTSTQTGIIASPLTSPS